MNVQEVEVDEPKAEEEFHEEYVITCDDFQEVCRTCLLKTDVRDANIEIEDIKVVNLLENYAGIKIKPNDDLPQNICNNCVTQFLQFHVFVENCQTNNLYLNQLLGEKSGEPGPLEDSKIDDVVELQLSLPQIILAHDEGEINLEEIADAGDAPVLHQPEESSQDFKLEVQATQSTLLKECLICTKICVPADLKKPTCKVCRKLKGQKAQTPKFICEFCGKEFDQSCALWNHRRMHIGLRKKVAMSTHNEETTCKYCGKFFKSSTRYNLHLKQHLTELGYENSTTLKQEEFECKQCKKTYDSAAKLKKHQINVHTNQKFLCPTCGKDFVRKVHLQTHLLVCPHKRKEPPVSNMRQAVRPRIQLKGPHVRAHWREAAQMFSLWQDVLAPSIVRPAHGGAHR